MYQILFGQSCVKCTNLSFFLFRGNLTNWLLINSDLPLKTDKKWRKIYFYLCQIWLDMVGYFWLYCLSGLCQQIILWLDGVIFSVDSLTHLMVMLLGKGGRRIWQPLFIQILFLVVEWLKKSKGGDPYKMSNISVVKSCWNFAKLMEIKK